MTQVFLYGRESWLVQTSGRRQGCPGEMVRVNLTLNFLENKKGEYMYCMLFLLYQENGSFKKLDCLLVILLGVEIKPLM